MRIHDLPEFLTTKEAAEAVGLSPRTLLHRRWSGEHAPRCVKTGPARSSRLVFRRADVLRFMHERGLIDADELNELIEG